MANPIVPGSLLAQVAYPADLRRLPEEQLYDFCTELRNYIIEHCSVYGGHFGASLGVVELTAALHYVFDTPYDQLIWDVGHQAYGHKIITGRRERFYTNRTHGGICGFPKRSESIYDTMGVGHSSTSISTALGMAVAAHMKGERNRKVVAVIGDGAMTAGLAFEGLNNAGAVKLGPTATEQPDMLVVLNDNCMSIDPNVGALKEYLIDITTSHTYNRLRDEVYKLLGKFKGMGHAAQKLAAQVEDVFTSSMSKPGMLFESLGFRYFGPIDGHDVNHLVRILRDLKDIKGPKLLHIVTVKGKGFAPAEAEQTKWHAPAYNFDKITGDWVNVKKPEGPQPPKYQDVFGKTVIELAKQNPKVVAVTPAMPSGSGLVEMMETMPDRCFDVGIAEQHAVTFSAGLATQGMRPFCNIYSSFMQRAYDQVIHDVAIQNLPVIFCMDRGGLVGADGATHQGAYDLAYMRCLPNMVVSAPMNEQELRNLMYTAQLDETRQPFSIRYPRGQGVMVNWHTPLQKVEIGGGRKLHDGASGGVAVLSIGHIGNIAAQAIAELQKEGIQPAHYDLRFAKPLDEALLHEAFTNYKFIVTVEDGCLAGGVGEAVTAWMADHGYAARVKRLGIPDRVIETGTQQEQYKDCGIDKASIAAAVRAFAAVAV
jgi:1-deoxy-D-xylulose-5-phosphate synthase